ncbi:MAG: hypothetical protein CO099_06195 [Bdellovibrio sp. CG_4_9_14_3_um_filter_39_7]|nr:MAG: hypothetical protein CO099_06195 [Bdellovibrio sp. CG_4_9_14_3_um_filter_39_7]
MTNEQKQTILLKELGKMFLATGQGASEAQIAAYIDYLREAAVENHSSFEDVIKAIRQTAKECDYPPRVSEIIKHLKPSQEDMDAELSAMTSDAMKTIRRLLAEGRGERPRFENATLQQAYNATMQREWNDCDEFDRYFAMTLKKNLTSFKGSGAYQQSLQLQEAQEKQERLDYYKNGGGMFHLDTSKTESIK